MSGLRPPPKVEKGSRVFLRVFVLVLLLFAVGVVVWAAVINQRIELTETLTIEDLALTGPSQVDDLTINVVHDGLGSQPVILLHDFDVAGGVLWDAVVAELGDEVTAVRIDLPGLGLSSRIPEEGEGHTVGAMAEVVSQIAAARFADRQIVIAGAGLGGEVAAEVAVLHPDLISGLVLIDVDFYRSDGWLEWSERLPFIGTAITYAFEGGGPFSQGRWAPRCGDGGWCPTRPQSETRDLAEQLVGTTDSLVAFRKTAPSSFVPSRLDEVVAPVVYIWSSSGEVPEEAAQTAVDAMPNASLIEVDAWKAHLDAPGDVAGAILSMVP